MALGNVAVAGPVFGFGNGRAVFLAVGPALAGLLCYVELPGLRRLTVCTFLVGLAMGYLHWLAPWQSYVRYLPRPECGAAIRVVVVEPNYAGRLVPPAKFQSVLVQLTAVRLGPERPWRRCRGKVLVRGASEGMAEYGTSLEADGAFLLPAKPRFPGDFNYRQYLRTRGVKHVFRAHDCRSLVPPHGWRRFAARLFWHRDRGIERMVRQLEPAENAALLAAMTLGVRRALSGPMSRTFLRSGAVHIVAISGLHVGIVAAMLLFVMRLLRVPFRWRYYLIIPLLGFYVYLTGGAPSALRAWTMLALWAWARARLVPAMSLNSVAVAALLLLLLNPFNAVGSGFLFSFIVVLALILGWRIYMPYHLMILERFYWVPPRHRQGYWRGRVLCWCAQLLVLGGMAWLGSAGLIMASNSRLILAGILINALISVPVFFCVCGGFCKLSVTALPGFGLERILSHVLARLLNLIRAVVRIGSHFPFSLALPCPSFGWLLGYYALLTAAFLPGVAGGRRVLALGGVGCMLALLLLRPVPRHTRLVVFSGNGQSLAACVVLPSGTRPPLVLYWGGRGFIARTVVSWLTAHGVNGLDAIVLAGSSRYLADDLDELVAGQPPKSLYLPSSLAADEALADALSELRLAGVRCRTFSDTGSSLEVVERKASLGGARGRDLRLLKVRLKGTPRPLELEFRPDPDRGGWLHAGQKGLPSRRWLIPISLNPRVQELEINQGGRGRDPTQSRTILTADQADPRGWGRTSDYVVNFEP
jgi:competence protein ComEC